MLAQLPYNLQYVLSAVYLLATFLSLSAALTEANFRDDPLAQQRQRFWIFALLVMFVFGIARYTSLWGHISHVLRGLAKLNGVYDGRHAFQWWMVLIIPAIGIGTALAIYLRFPSVRGLKLPIVTLVMLLVYTCARACSFHPIDAILNSTLALLPVGIWIELGILAAFCAVAVQYLKGLPSCRKDPLSFPGSD